MGDVGCFIVRIGSFQLPLNLGKDRFGRESLILGSPDVGCGSSRRNVAPPGDHLRAVLPAGLGKKRFPKPDVLIDPAIYGSFQKLPALQVVENHQLFGRNLTGRAHDLQGKTVQGANIESCIGQAGISQATANAGAEGVDARIEKGDDKHLLAVHNIHSIVGD